MRKYLLSFVFLFALINVCIGQSEKSLTSNPTKLTVYVTDETGTLKADEIVSLKTKLRKFYDSTSTQILVLLVPTLNGEPIEMVANAIYHANGIGGKGKDNGALLMISKGDRKIRIEVGYGLEGVLTDAMSKQIIQKEISPELKQNNYYKGIDNAVNSMIALSKGEYTADKSKTSNSSGSDIVFILLMTIFPIMIIVIIIFAVIRAKKGLTSGSRNYGSSSYSSGSSSDSYYSGGSDSSSSSSDSGFSGGGGDSGGGGASGDY